MLQGHQRQVSQATSALGEKLTIQLPLLALCGVFVVIVL